MTQKNPSHWLRAILDMPEAYSEVVQAMLFELGAHGVEVEDDETRAVPEKPFMPTGRATVIATLDDTPQLRAHIQELVQEGMQVRFETLEPQDWDAQFKASWKVLDLGKGVFVVPSWEKERFRAENPDALTLYLDPGMAFGTGHHETTALCTQALVDVLHGQTDNHLSILDVGTGTGILAILAAKLCPKASLMATDIDEEALAIAQENAEGNGLTGRIVFRNQSLDALGKKFDVVVANILANPLIEMASAITGALAPKGTLLLSGILASQAESVITAYQAAGCQHLQTRQQGDWVCLVFDSGNP